MSFSVYVKAAAGVSGYFFFSQLARELLNSVHHDPKSKNILVNVSVSLFDLICLRLKGYFITIRLDNAYHDNISCIEFKKFSLLWWFGRSFGSFNTVNWLFNFLNENWKVELRCLFCDSIIYQSEFSRSVHRTFLIASKKPHTVIHNAYPIIDRTPLSGTGQRSKILIVLSKRASKNDETAIRFAIKLCKKFGLQLKILNWLESEAYNFKDQVEKGIFGGFIEVHPGYENLDELFLLTLDCKVFIFLSYRDACPNILLETIAMGMLPVTVSSGGIPEMVPNGYPLIKLCDPFETYSPARYSTSFPKVNFKSFERVFSLVYYSNVQSPFDEKFSLALVSKKYVGWLLNREFFRDGQIT